MSTRRGRAGGRAWSRPSKHVSSRELDVHIRAWPALARSHLAVRGSLEGRAGPLLLEAVGREVTPGHLITLDLSDVTSIDGDGTEAVRACREIAEQHGAELIVEDPSPIVRHALGGAQPSRDAPPG